MNKGLFLDLDGTLIQTISGLTFPKDTADWKFTPGVVDVVKQYVMLGYSVHIVSNQGGIEAGFHTTEEITDKFKTITVALAELLIKDYDINPLITYQFCPVLNPNDAARKPNIGMLTYIRDKHGVDLNRSVFVGDMDSDKTCASNAGCSYYDINDFLELGEPTPPAGSC